MLASEYGKPEVVEVILTYYEKLEKVDCRKINFIWNPLHVDGGRSESVGEEDWCLCGKGIGECSCVKITQQVL